MSAREGIAARVRTVLAQVMGVPAASIGPDFSSETTANWTSLNHLMLISQLESEFGVFFASQQIQQLTSLDRIVTAVAEAGPSA